MPRKKKKWETRKLSPEERARELALIEEFVAAERHTVCPPPVDEDDGPPLYMAPKRTARRRGRTGGRPARLFDFHGRQVSLAQAARETGIPLGRLYNRVMAMGLTLEAAVAAGQFMGRWGCRKYKKETLG